MRLDNYLVEKGFFDSRTKSKQAIERGEIFLNGKQICKSSFDVNQGEINIKRVCEDSYVSLGGYKLKKALVDFELDVSNFICADIGASTGGFTDCLIQSGVKKVYSIDLNDQLLHFSLKQSSLVYPIIKNVKDLSRKDFTDSLDLIVADLSFISVTLALPIMANLLDDNKKLLILIKPQFEVNEKRKFKNGIIRDKKIQLEACVKAYDCALTYSLTPIKFTTAPINQDKNIEFLMLFEKNGKRKMELEQINF